jgi:hypothetical protein
MIPKGIHYNLGMAEYHAWKLNKAELIKGPISCSMLKAFAPNPYEWLKSPDFEPSEAMRMGSLYDLAVTDAAKLETEVVVSPFENYRTKEAQEWKKQTIEDGYLIVAQDELDGAIKAAQAIHDHPVAGKIMNGAKTQVSVIGEITGIPAKCLIDILPENKGKYAETIFDYKTTSKGLDDESIRKTIGDYKYHWQAAYYRTLANKVFDDRHFSEFGFIFQSIKTHEIRVVLLSDDSLSLGTRAVGQAVKDYVKAAHKGIHSRYLQSADTLELMPYHAMNEDEQLSKIES